jgi:pimeloyl-ACP methyl ester carboxylesterase
MTTSKPSSISTPLFPTPARRRWISLAIPASSLNGALKPVPVPGGDFDLYLRHEADGSYPGFAECFANGVKRNEVALLEAVQRPASIRQFDEPSGDPAWETIPSWSLIGTADRVIPPAQQLAMSTNAGAHISNVDAGHLSLVTRPDVVTRIIETAVDAST